MSQAGIIHDASIRSLCRVDAVFSGIVERYGTPPDWSRPEGFETLCRIILEQQVSLESAQAAYRKLAERLGEFRPETMLQLDDVEMRSSHVSRQKARYLRALSEAVLSGSLDLPKLRTLAEPEVRAQLTAVKGIGPWTAEVYLMFCLQAPDIFPLGDIAAVNSARLLWGLEDREAVEARSREWAPFRTAATFFLWHDYLCRRGRSVHY